MPAGFPQGARALALAAAVLMGAQLPTAHAADVAPVINSELDAPLFYQLLIGEIGLREGDAGTALRHAWTACSACSPARACSAISVAR